MSAETAALSELKRELGELKDLKRIASLLAWDQEVMMPAGGADARADQLSTLGRIIHERATSPELGKLLDAAEPVAAGLDPDSDDARLVSVARRDFEKEIKVPADLSAAMVRAAAKKSCAAMPPGRAPGAACIWARSITSMSKSTYM